MHVYYNCTYKVTKDCGSTTNMLLHATFSRLKSEINWRLISNCTRLIMIKIFNLSPLLRNIYLHYVFQLMYKVFCDECGVLPKYRLDTGCSFNGFSQPFYIGSMSIEKSTVVRRTTNRLCLISLNSTEFDLPCLIAC